MSKKPLGKDKFGVQKVMRVKDYFGDAMGQFALNAMSALVGQLTDVYKRQVQVYAGKPESELEQPEKELVFLSLIHIFLELRATSRR